MSDDQFTKLFKYMQKEFKAIRFELSSVEGSLRHEIDKIYNLLDVSLKRSETDEQERLAIGRQLENHEDWISRASKKLKIKYNH